MCRLSKANATPTWASNGGICLAPKNFEQLQIDPALVWHREVDGLAHPASPQTLAVFMWT